jgi:hypothetical protein
MPGRLVGFVTSLWRRTAPTGPIAASSRMPLQRRFAELTAKLELSPDLLLQGETPPGVNRQRIADVLEDAISRLGWSDEPRLERKQQLDVTSAAAERLISLNALADAEHVSRAAHPRWADTLKMTRIRLSALLQMENAERLEEELRRQELRIEHEPRLREVLRRFRSKPEFQNLLARERFAQLTTLLGLSHDLLLEGEASEGIDRKRIAISLAESVEKLGLGDNPSLTPEQQLNAASDAAQALVHRRAYAEAEHVTNLANPEWADTPAMIRVRLHALLASRERSRMGAEIARLSARPDLQKGGDEVLRRFLRVPGAFRSLPNLLDYHDLLWGELKPDLLEKILDLRREPGHLAHLAPKLESNLWALRSGGTESDPGFIADLRWGATAYFYFLYLWNGNARINAEPTGFTVDTDRARRDP